MALLATIKLALKRILPPDLVLRIKMIRHAKRIAAVAVGDEIDFRPLHALVRPGDAVFDVGANMGYYAKYLSDLVGPSGAVYAVEPIPDTLRILRYVVRTLGLANVTVVNNAVSDEAGTVTMGIPRLSDGEENIFEAKIIEGAPAWGDETVRVPSTTLDILAAETGTPIAFIKCDIEGHELPCLRGAAALLRRDRPSWLIEVWGSPDETGSAAHATFDLLENAGYRAYWFDGTRMRPRLPGETSVNYFFLAEKHLPMLAASGLFPEGAAR